MAGRAYTAAMLGRDFLVEAIRSDPAARALWDAGLRARVGVSACLMGETVRYDGDHRRATMVVSMLPLVVDIISLCPEVAIGMGVPRPTIQRVRLADGREVVRGIEDPSLDVTARLDDYAARIVGENIFHGYVLKARSPSCAPGNAPLFDEHGTQIGVAAGRYAEHLRRAFPRAPMCDEEALVTVGQVAGFVAACYRHAAAVARPAR